MKTTLGLALLSAALVLGCGKKDSDGAKGTAEGGKAAGGEGDKATPAAKNVWKKVGTLGVEVEVAEDAEIDDKSESAHFPTATIWASPTTFVSGQNEMFWEADLAKAKEEIQKDPNPFKAFTKEEGTGDEFHVEYTLESMMDKAPVYGVKIRRKIGEALFDCGSNTGSEDERKKVVAICSSMRPAAP